MLDTPRSVREITDRIRGLFESDPLLGDLWITGEVIESTVSRSGHVFFTLGGDGAQIRCVLFRLNALRQRSLPSPGSVCVAHGRIEVYANDGTYQFYADLIEEAGIGLAALELELLRQQLEAEGLFSESRKRPLPTGPRVIGIVTSESGSVWHDIQNVIRRRYPFARLLIAPATVQGDAAPASLVSALSALVQDARAEVIIIARGGGSASDLSAFNDEALVRAVFAAPVPVVSAIGHETDWTLLDLVADLRAPTPSAAAELATPSIDAILGDLIRGLALHTERFERGLTSRTMDVERLTATLDRIGPSRRLADGRNRLQAARDGIVDMTAREMKVCQGAHSALRDSVSGIMRASLDQRAGQTERTSDLLQALSPTRTLARGYAFVEHGDTGRPLRSPVDIAPGHRMRTRFLDGSVDSVVSSISHPAS